MAMKIIENYQELLNYAIACLDSTKALEPAEISDNLNFKIKIKGPSWDGAIDYRIAKYVIDIQNSVNKLLLGHLNKEEIDRLYAQLKEKHSEGKIPFTLPLKITAKYTEREIKEATIFGIGGKRDNTQNIADLVK